jgi:hypothetical protein
LQRPNAAEPTPVEPYSVYSLNVLHAGHCVQKTGASEGNQNGLTTAQLADRN